MVKQGSRYNIVGRQCKVVGIAKVQKIGRSELRSKWSAHRKPFSFEGGAPCNAIEPESIVREILLFRVGEFIIMSGNVENMSTLVSTFAL